MFLMWVGIFGPQTEKARFSNWVRVLTTTAALVIDVKKTFFNVFLFLPLFTFFKHFKKIFNVVF